MRKNLLVLFTVVLSLIMVACTDTIDVNFQFTESEVTIKVGDTYTLEYDLTENYEVEYTLSESGVISISESKITALAVGEVTITATVVGLDVSDSITIIVEPADDPVVDVDSVTISGDAAGFIGDEITLTATVLPSAATNKDVTWTSSDETLATVDGGIVTLLQEGTVTITATADGIEATHDIEISAVIIDVESVTISG
ncbi:MAG: Ig-like domain-containing protein, partial [Acholeplasma sp.]